MRIPRNVLFDFDGTLYDTHGTGRLYPDVGPSLEALQCWGWKYWLLTAEVNTKFQQKKIESSGIGQYIPPENVIIVPRTEDKEDALRKLYKMTSWLSGS